MPIAEVGATQIISKKEFQDGLVVSARFFHPTFICCFPALSSSQRDPPRKRRCSRVLHPAKLRMLSMPWLWNTNCKYGSFTEESVFLSWVSSATKPARLLTLLRDDIVQKSSGGAGSKVKPRASRRNGLCGGANVNM